MRYQWIDAILRKHISFQECKISHHRKKDEPNHYKRKYKPGHLCFESYNKVDGPMDAENRHAIHYGMNHPIPYAMGEGVDLRFEE